MGYSSSHFTLTSISYFMNIFLDVFGLCSFGIQGNGTEVESLFTLANPVGRAGNLKSYLQLWEPASGKLRKSYAFNESLAALAVRDDGMFVAVGTMFSGSVSIHIAFSLQVGKIDFRNVFSSFNISNNLFIY